MKHPVSSHAKAEGAPFLPRPKPLVIDYLFLDVSVCNRCQGTESALKEALDLLRPVLGALGVSVTVNRIHVNTRAKALQLGFISSPTLRVNGLDLQPQPEESLCESCGVLCGDVVDCREWTYGGQRHTEPPPALIVEGVLKGYFGILQGTPAAALDALPDNLERYFQRMEDGQSVLFLNDH